MIDVAEGASDSARSALSVTTSMPCPALLDPHAVGGDLLYGVVWRRAEQRGVLVGRNGFGIGEAVGAFMAARGLKPARLRRATAITIVLSILE